MITPFCKHDPNREVLYCATVQPFAKRIPGNRALNNIGPVIAGDTFTPVKSACGTIAFQGTNPLLMDAMRGQRLLLNRPPFENGIAPDLSNIYTPTIRKYGKGYTSYNDINAGQYQYWVPKQPEVYFSPVFVKPSKIKHTILTDPMDIKHPQWNRVPNPCEWNKCLVNQNVDSYTHDTLEFREQLIALQQRRENERDYRYRIM
jgi:hypothetical protein